MLGEGIQMLSTSRFHGSGSLLFYFLKLAALSWCVLFHASASSHQVQI